jgi:diphosphomevalonate decarboxylase
VTAPTQRATAVAQPNIALVKYWGKRDPQRNLPATGSLSVTLSELRTTTEVELDPALERDELTLNGVADESARLRVSRLLTAIRGETRRPFAHVRSHNSFPTAAGLASSASGFAALVVAACRAYGIEHTPAELSALARTGSGSAARSIFGGFVEMQRGAREDGSDAVARPVLAPESWPLAMLVVVTSTSKKPVGSTEAMERTRLTSPYYGDWVASTEVDLVTMRAAVLVQDLERVGELAEHSCLKMHALTMAARPPVVYWTPSTLAVMRAVWELRAGGTPAYFTIDAGPQVKVLTSASEARRVAESLATLSGVERVIVDRPGEGARWVLS